MVQLIVGNKGKGKTKYLLDKVNSEVKNVSGNIVYLDKSTKHMFELNNKVLKGGVFTENNVARFLAAYDVAVFHHIFVNVLIAYLGFYVVYTKLIEGFV